MQGLPAWRSTIAITCSLAVALVVVVWNMRRGASSSKKPDKCKVENGKVTDKPKETVNCCSGKTHVAVNGEANSDSISELPNPKWVKVGQVKEMYIYPLKSGRGKDIQECNFTEYGISLEKEGLFTLRDRMFVVFNEDNCRYQSGRQFPTLILVNVSAVDEFKVKLEATGMPSLIFSVPKVTQNNTEAFECMLWGNEPVKCIDCGPKPAEWLSRFLTGTNSGLRLGYSAIEQRRQVTKQPWQKISKVYDKLRDEDTGLLSDIMSYMIMTAPSVEKLNEKLETPVTALQFRPNILVSGQEPFAEDNWEWIRVGERAVIRNVKPCPRCKLSCLNPETAVLDKEEPVKTLRTFREQTDPERIAVDGKAPLMGIYCGLYVCGKVRLGDDVFVHVPDDSTELNGKDDKSKMQSA